MIGFFYGPFAAKIIKPIIYRCFTRSGSSWTLFCQCPAVNINQLPGIMNTRNKSEDNKTDLTSHSITENDVLDILGSELPEINPLLEKTAIPGSVYNVMQTFVDFTKQLLLTGDLKEVKHCFNIAETLILEGNNTVRNAIENVYVYSIGTVVALSSLKTNALKDLFTGPLRKEFNKQVCSGGI